MKIKLQLNKDKLLLKKVKLDIGETTIKIGWEQEP